jgi:NADH dehydrogenase (ubiquinone) Fe-S protein 4
MSLIRAGTRTATICLRGHPSFTRSAATIANAPAEATPKKPILDDLPNTLVPAEAQDVIVADTISGAPRTLKYSNLFYMILTRHSGELRHRTVRIYQPTRNTMQSGGAKGERWRIDWDILSGSGRWENPLMGYASS